MFTMTMFGRFILFLPSALQIALWVWMVIITRTLAVCATRHHSA